jgi:hypothetical protein
MNFNLGDKIWYNNAKSLMPEYVRVIGRVIGKVFIKDINKIITYNTTVDIIASEAQSSKDLVNAIQNKWVDIVYGKEYLQMKQYTTERLSSVQELKPQIIQNNSQKQIEDIKNLVTNETQKAIVTIGETVSQVLNEIKKLQNTTAIDPDLANTIAQQIIHNMPNISKQVDKSTDNEVAENVFINVDDGKELKTNIKTGELGEVTKLKTDKVKSITSKLRKMQK